MPVIGLMLSFVGMILQGGFHKLLGAMGRSDMDDYRRIFSLTLIFTFLVDFIFLAICVFGTNGVLSIAGGAKASPEAVAMGRLYIQTACLMILFFSLGSLFQLVMATYGYQMDRMICSVICVVVNVAASMLFINLLPEAYQIAGLGIGSALATVAQMLTAWVMMRRRGIRVAFRFCPVNRKNIVDSLDMLRRGLPSSIDNMLDSASGSVVNRIILSAFADGTAVLALVSIIKTLLNIIRTVGRGAFYASEPLVGNLHGGRDNERIKKTFTATIKIGLIYATGMAVLLLLLKNPLLAFYHVSENPDAHTGVILLALSGLLAVFSFAFNAVYESTEHLLLSLLVAVVPDSVLYPLLIPVLSRPFGITGVWLAMGLNFIPFFIVFYLMFLIVNRRFPVPLEKLLALKRDAGRTTALDVSIPVEAKNVTFVSEQLQHFFLEHGTQPEVAYSAALCMEEIAADYLEHRNAADRAGKKAYMDIKAFRDAGNIEIILRNYDDPYNPLVFERETESFSKIGVTMVQWIAKETSCGAKPKAAGIPDWASDSPAMASIVTFVEAVTDESSPDYLPPEARIVLFDSDGTLIGERYPTYSDQCMLLQRLLHEEGGKDAPAEDLAFAEALEAAIENHEPLPDSPRSTAQMAAEAFAGFTVEEYQAYVREFLDRDVPGFEGMTYGGRFFVPMVELVRYLAEHDFQVYICSGTERLFLRELIAGTLDQWIPPDRVIGSTFSLTATGQGDKADRDYTYAPEDEVLLEGDLIFKNLKMGKVISIVNEIGAPPVMVFGNSSGDFAMGQYALQHGGRAYMLLCDDTERDYGDTEAAAEFAGRCFETVSMRSEFETIYAETVAKTWTEGLDAAA